MNLSHRFRTLAAILLMVLLSWCSSPQVATADSWSFAVLGDQQNVPSGINTPIVMVMAAQIATQNPAFVLCGGDNILGVAVPGGPSLAQQYTNWKTAMAPILSISYPVRGNHEAFGADSGPGPNYDSNAQAWLANIGNSTTGLPQIPQNDPPNEVGMSYSFSDNNVSIFALGESSATQPLSG